MYWFCDGNGVAVCGDHDFPIADEPIQECLVIRLECVTLKLSKATRRIATHIGIPSFTEYSTSDRIEQSESNVIEKVKESSSAVKRLC